MKGMKLVASKMLQNCSSARYDDDSYVIRGDFCQYSSYKRKCFPMFWTFLLVMESVQSSLYITSNAHFNAHAHVNATVWLI